MKLRQFSTFVLLCALFFYVNDINAQLTGYQNTVKKCYTGPTLSFGNTTGTSVGNINFASGIDIPPGHKIVDVVAEIVWSKTDDGSCTPITGVAADLSHVGFQIRGPVGLARYLATSAATGPFASPATGASFTGTYPALSPGVIRDTIVFKDGYPSLLPAGLPNHPTRDTVSPNNSPLSFYIGQNPYGLWSIGAIDDAPLLGPQLCIHSYCITLVTCDNTRLKASCKANPTIFLNATGVHTFQFSNLDSISDVSCKLKTLTFSPASVTCAHVGSTVPVTMTIRDNLDSVKSCVSMVRVRDNSKPTITSCFPSVWSVRYLKPNGRDTIWADSVNIVNDNCLPVTRQVRPLSSPIWRPFIALNCVTGFQQFWLKATDASGNRDSCRVIVNMLDRIAPNAICGRDTAFLTTANNGAVTVAAIDVDAGSFDVCPPIVGRWINVRFAPPPVYTCADIGIDTVSLIVADASSNLDTCHNAVVVVVDRVPPDALCKNDTVYLDATGVGYVYASNVDNGSKDTCGIDSININGTASRLYNCSHLNAPQPVTLNVFDASGNTDFCSAMVIVRDTFPPVANCNNRTVYLNSSGTVSVSATSLNNASLDVCTGTNLTFNIGGSSSVSFNCASMPTNPNMVTLTVRDTFGNTSTCTSLITVVDTVLPNAICAIPNVYLNNTGVATVTATQLNNTSTDNCGVNNVSINVVGLNSVNFNCAAIFTPQPATLIVRDASGNTDNCVTTVNVMDTVRPRAFCEAYFTANLNAAGVAVVNAASIDSNSTDNCGIVRYLINGASSVTYTCANLGNQTATLTVRDSSGNTRTCTSTIRVEDNIAPAVSCQTTIAYLDLAGLSTIVPNNVLVYPATSDNCGTLTTTFSSGNSITYNCDSIGTRSVIVLVTDNYGNTASCVTSVTVADTVSPTAFCRAVPFNLNLDATGNGCVSPLDIDNGSYDLCSIDTMLVNSSGSFCFTCANLGNNLVTLSVIDNSGNQSTCQATVNVRDLIPPVAVCQNRTVYLNGSGVVTVLPSAINGGSSDNCSFSLSINNLPSVTYNCSQVGSNSVQLIATDGGGNTHQCTANITVLDTIKPTANCIAPATRQVYLNSSCFASITAASLNSGSLDNCSLAASAYTVGGLTTVSFSAANLATNPNALTLRVADASGNFSFCNTSVIVLDTIKPTVTCQPDTLLLNASGVAVATPMMILGTASDNCSGSLTYTINGTASVNYSCTNIGSNAVTLTARDASGNTRSCNTTILVRDLEAPDAICRATQTLNLTAGGTTGTLTTGMVDFGSTDNCSISSFSLSQTNFSCADVLTNPHTVTLYVTDGSGNIDSCTSQITVVDNTAPTASCQALTLYLPNGTVTATPSMLLSPITTDNCSSYSSTFLGGGTSIVYDCDSVGIHFVTVVVTDISGNTASCVTTITVEDTIKPIASCISGTYTVQLDASGNGCVTPLNVNNGSSDYCGIDTMLVNGVASYCYTCANVGTTSVTLSVTDEAGLQSTCVANIIVNDPINPVAICQNITAYLGASGLVTVNASQINNNSTDNCSIVSYKINGFNSFNYNCTNIGVNSAQLTITDISGNTSQCIANVTVVDTIKPVANCVGLGIVRAYLDNSCFASLPASAFNSGSTNNCASPPLTFLIGGLPNITFNGSNIATNPNPITLTVRDASGNTSTCNTNVTVLDTIRPTIACQPDTVQLSGATAVVTPAMINAGYLDNCGGTPTYTINNQPSISLGCANLGSNTVVLRATDASGNFRTCTTTVFVRDVTAPIASCMNATISLNSGTNTATLQSINVNNSSTDNCAVASYALSRTNFDCSDVFTGPHTVTLYVFDASGNVDSCTSQITVQDTIKPLVSCQPDTMQLDVFGAATATASMVLLSSSDNCGGTLSYTINGGTFVNYSCANLGLNNVTLTARDPSGNTTSCNTTILIRDLIAPNANCRPTQTLNLVTNGTTGTLTSSMVNLGSTDNCAVSSYSLSRSVFSCADVLTSPHTITLYAFDANGNVDSCTTQITVRDNTAPVASCQPTTLYLPNGTVTATPNMVLAAPPTGDNCTSYTATFLGGNTNIVYNCDSVGTHTVTVVITDISGNTSSCAANITVVDTIRPIANCVSTPYAVQLDSSGNGCVTPLNVDNSSYDFCGITTMLVNGASSFCYTCANVGTTSVTLSVIDNAGLQSNCVAPIIVNDPINPVAICQNTTVYMGASGIVTIVPSQINGGSTDNCSIVNYRINGQNSFNYTCANIGVNTAQLMVTDISGNTTQCAANVTVVDTVKPTANCVAMGSATVYLDNSCFATVPASIFNNGSLDNCTSTLTYFVSGLPNASFNGSHIGTNPNTITLTVRDASGNASTCTTNVTVLDTINPAVTCQPATVQLIGNTAVITPQMINGGALDNCAAPTLTINGQPSITLDCSDLDSNTVVLTATDMSGNTQSCTTIVIIEDVTAPVAICNITTTVAIDPATNLAILQPIHVDNNSTDNCTINNYYLSQTIFDCSHLFNGPHLVTMVVEDQSGNLDSCVAQVTVLDTIAPIAQCKNDTLYYGGTTININAIDLDAGSSDNCSILGLNISQDTFNCPDIGVTPVVLTVTDSSGNIGTCISMVTLLDSTAIAEAGLTQVLCTADSTTLAATPVSGIITGTWSTSAIVNINNINSPTAAITNMTEGTAVMYWILSSPTCPFLSMDSVEVHVIFPSPDIADAGVDQRVCNTTTAQLTATPLTKSTGRWTQSAAQASAGVVIVDTASITSTVTGLGIGNTYTFVWELTNSLCGVHSTDTVVIVTDILPSDIANAGPDIICSPSTVTLAATTPSMGQGAWTSPSTALITPTNSPTASATNFLQDTTALIWSLSNGACTDYSQDTMYIILDDVAPVALPDSVSLIPDGTISIIDVTTNDFVPANWLITIHTPMAQGQMNNQGNGRFDIDINAVNLNQTFIYEICNADCPIVCDTALVEIGVQPPGDCYTPNAFTPNNDGSNDYFIIPCLSNYTEKAALHVFNRWGNVVYETDNYKNDWMGTYRGQPLPEGAYFYILHITGKNPQQGSIEIKY